MQFNGMLGISQLALAVSVAVAQSLGATQPLDVVLAAGDGSVPSGHPSVNIPSEPDQEPNRSSVLNGPLWGGRTLPQNPAGNSGDPAFGSPPNYPPCFESPEPQRVWPPPSWVGVDSLSDDVEADSGKALAEDSSAHRSEYSGVVGVAIGDEWLLLPRGLMYQSYLAGPREPRFGYAWLYDTANDTWVNDAAIGGRFGILRYGDRDPFLPEGWQLDLEGAAFPRLAETSLDLIATDYRFGVPLTGRTGPLQWKLAYYHLSSHLGDEYLLNTAPDFDRINFSRNAVVAGLGYFLTADVRLYSEVGYGFLNDGGNQPWEFQFGAEYRPFLPTGWRGAPFVAGNAHLREEVDFGGSFNFMAGWAWQGSDSSYLLRAGLQYFNGHSSQFEFLGDSEQLLGLGLWLDL